ncbi:MAG: LuxR C-terminal-related transcriptional regulator [Gammaproteobacteria bacterium]|nr:LuxR C-terminal-related transcriptional regulator [Gammaproteobacteria bacterium]
MAAAVLVLDRQGRVIFMNRAARQLVTDGDALQLEGLEPVAAFRGARRGLAVAINRIIVGEVDGERPHGGATLQLPRQSGRRPLNIMLTRLPASQPFARGGVAAIFITDPERIPPSTEDLLADLYNLTRREAALARDLMNGITVEEHARSRQVSINTTRTHLRNLLRKTHTRRQGELAALLLRTGSGIV